MQSGNKFLGRAGRVILWIALMLMEISVSLGQGQVLRDTIKPVELQEVVVKANPIAIGQSGDGGVAVNVRRLDKLPQLVGTPDPIRLLQMYPGVASGGDVNTGLFVRGGDPSQNLMLFNGAPLIHVMHFTGLFSTFIPDHLSGFTLYKSYLPPAYGGRVGAMLSVESRQDIAKRFELSADVSFLASNMTVAVPLSPRMCLYLSGRASYLSLYRSLSTKLWKEDISMGYDFGDLNATLIGQVSNRDQWTLNYYAGGDDLNILAETMDSEGSIFWANSNMSFRWRHEGENDTRWENVLYLTTTRDRYGLRQNSQDMSLRSEVQEYGMRSQWQKDTICGGQLHLSGELIYRKSIPQYLKMQGGVFSSDSLRKQIETMEYGVGVEWIRDWKSGIQLRAGVRNSGLFYQRKDASTGYYGGWEPRLQLRYKPEKNHQYSFSYTVQRQYYNEVFVSQMGLPTDYRVPSSEGIPSQVSYGPTLGYRYVNHMHDLSVELFYKRQKNQFFSVMGMNEMISKSYTITDRFSVGEGYNYGAEFSWKLSLGTLSVLTSYTLSWAMRTCREIEEGRYFPASNDRRHDVSCLIQYPLSRNWSFSAYGVYASGQPYTPSLGMYLISDRNVQLFGPYNSGRFPDYHRADIAFTRNLRWKWAKNSALNLSVINVYGRRNPFFIHSTVDVAANPPKISTVYRYVSLFGMVPSVGLTISL